MSASRITRRHAGTITLAVGLTAGLGANGKTRSGSLAAEGASIEWQRRPLALDKARPRFHWTLRAVDAKARGLTQSAHRTRILSAADRRVIFDSGRVADGVSKFQPEAAIAFASQTPYIWELQVWDQDGLASPIVETRFATGLIAPDDGAARWIALQPDADDRHRAVEGHAVAKDHAEPLPIFRKTFVPPSRPVFAHLAVVGLGQYQVWLNGRQVSPHGLNGGWTDYDRRVLYDGYDVTGLITPGRQTIGVALGNGFFNVENVKGRYTKLDGRFGQPQLWLRLQLHYADGRQETIVSDGSWQARIGGTTFSSIYGGEDFDGRRDDGQFGAHDDWQSASVVAGPKGPLQASTFEPANEAHRIAAAAVSPPNASTLVYDFGINHAGRPRIRLDNMPPGTVVRMLPGELRLDDGMVDQSSMTGGGAPGLHGVAFTYTCRGGKTEVWQPQFTYTGYRYVQVEGAAPHQIRSLESLVVHANLDTTGTFTCSDTRMEAIHGLIHQALLSNTVSVLTDCPTREKLGWLEQIYLNAATAMNNLDCVRLYEKMCQGMRDAQETDGMVPAIAPEFIRFLDKDGRSTRFRDTPEWGAAVVLAPWYVYQRYGDIGILSDNYPAMTAYMAYLERRLGDDGLLDFGLGDWYDIGPKPPGVAQLTSRKMTGTATYYAQLVVVGKVAGLLGKPEADSFAGRAAALAETLRTRLYNADKATFDTGSQTAQAMALVLGLVPVDGRSRALDVLVADIRSRDNHVTAGDIGFHYVVRALNDGGRSDVLYDMLSRTDRPSYLQQIANGATALTEAWDARRQSSQNHFMLGHAEIWFFQGLGGVTVDFAADGAAPIVLAPQVVAGIDACAVSSATVLGPVSCRLSRQGEACMLDVEVPAGQSARLRLPFRSGTMLEGGAPVEKARGVALLAPVDGAAWVKLGSGTYRFSGHV